MKTAWIVACTLMGLAMGACADQGDDQDDSVFSDDTGKETLELEGKADGANRPRGTYKLAATEAASASMPKTLVLMSDNARAHSFFGQYQQCPPSQACALSEEQGRLRYTRSGSTRYVTLARASENSKYAYRFTTGSNGQPQLLLRKTQTRNWVAYDVSATNWCAQAAQCALQDDTACADATYACSENQCVARCAPQTTLTSTQFVERIASLTRVNGQPLYYMSESDYPVLATVLGDAPAQVSTQDSFTRLERAVFPSIFDNVTSYHDELTAEGRFGAAATERIARLPEIEADAATIAAWQQIVDTINTQLTQVHVVQIGPKAPDGTLWPDHGLYAYGLVGITSDGKLVAVYFGSVET